MTDKNNKNAKDKAGPLNGLDDYDLPVVVIRDKQTVQCNQAFVVLMNSSEEKLVGMPVESLFAQFATEAGGLESTPFVLKEAPVPQTVFLKPLGNLPVCAAMSIKKKTKDNQDFFIVFFSLINGQTDQHQKDEIFRYRESSKVWHVALFDHDHRTNKIIMSPLYREIYGVETDDELTFENAGKFIHPDDVNLEAVFKAHDPSGDGLFDLAFRIIRPNGEIRWIHSRSQTFFDTINGKKQAVRTTGAIVDFTDEYLLKKALEENKQKLSDILDSLSSMVLSVDQNGVILQWNKSAEKYSNIEKQPPEERKLELMFPMLSSKMEQIQKALSLGEALELTRIPYSNSHSISFYNVCVIPLSNPNETGAVIRIDDVSEAIRIEQMLIQSEKLHSIGGLAAGMAHEINNPLAAIVQNAQVIQSRLSVENEANHKAAEDIGLSLKKIFEYVENRRIPDMIANIREAGGRASTIVRNMLGFVRLSNEQHSSCNVTDLIDVTIELLMNDYELKKNYAFHSVKILKEYDGDDLRTLCDSGKIQQVVLNLLKNAAQALYYVKKTSPRITIRVHKAAKGLVVEVEDNGPGIPDEISRRVFEPFFTTKPPGEGTGLGLAIAYSIIVKEHKGAMHIQKGLEGGTNFIIELPLLD